MKKLIEVALPLETINKESAREKSIRHGHPSTLHLWWARRPLAACRAVLWSSLVDDPSEYMPDEESANRERERLFAILEELVKWENSNNEEILDKARLEIARSVARDLGVDVPVGKQAIREFLATKAPPVLDPFAGGGSIPLEAQRLGLRAFASDLNPVAVLINKALIEIPPRFAGLPPVHPSYVPHPPAPSPTWGEGGDLARNGEGESHVRDGNVASLAHKGEGEYLRLEVPESLRRKMVEVARQFRKEPTHSEDILWQSLRGKKLDGVKFRRQQPIGPFIVDFYAPAHRLVVEVDGPIHEIQKEADQERQQLLEQLGLFVLRLTAAEVEQALPQALAKIQAILKARPISSSSFMGDGKRGEEGVQIPLFKKEWHGAQGLAEDVRYYGQWMRAEAEKRIGHLYPKVKITAELLAERTDLRQQGLKPGDELTVIAWLWARTVKCPNPACGAQMPLVRSFALSTKKGKEAWVEPLINFLTTKGERVERKAIRFNVRIGSGKAPEGTVNRNGAHCIACGTPVPLDHIRAEGKAGRMSAQLMAIVAEGRGGRVYLPPLPEHAAIAEKVQPAWKPEQELQGKCRVSVPLYGMNTFGDLFTPRQLTALTTFSDLVGEARQKVLEDARASGVFLPIPNPSPTRGEGRHPPIPSSFSTMGEGRDPTDSQTSSQEEGREDSPHPQPFPHKGGREDYPYPQPFPHKEGRECPPTESLPSPLMGEGTGVRATPESYANAVATYLAFAVDKGANYWSSFCAWHSNKDIIVSTFARQALPMVWDYAEANPLSDSSGNFLLGVEQASDMLENVPAIGEATVRQSNAMENTFGQGIVISTDPPYYDNICYADLSDFFYVWLRYSLKSVYPSLFATMTVPKTTELVATPYRFDGDKRKAEEFFETGLRQTFKNFRYIEHPVYPTTVFYAFKQTETDDEIETNGLLFDTRASTGWETMLAGLIESGFQITGTLPMRTELVTSLKKSINALATSVVLVCRPRSENAGTITRREFLAALKRELPPALRELQKGNIAPVDLAQAAIGPGMAIFSRYRAVLEADGSPMPVRAALALINQALDEYLAEQEGEYDADTRWALAWFEQYGHEQGPYGVAETLSKAKNTSVEGLAQACFLEARAGKVRLLRRDELEAGWDPARDMRLTAWEAMQHLIRTLDREGEKGAGVLLGKLGALGETARDLAYRLYTICERKGWAQEALAYNMLVVAWPRIKEQACSQRLSGQERLL